ncbi:carbonic anhydrase [Formosimonas limnophila]|uniref:Carbonic anhydrase n=1 Tax=Formosimonas limnophila TaxID=1384487 RepID=A0A8J3CGL7_9BURK|nr:carbonate dehydratase [Formosimonas limnophila]GHA70509.1 carbonic anhydrase [Formosimonas limnophila]
MKNLNPPRLPRAALKHLLDNNRMWSERTRAIDEHFFESLAQQQAPEYMWIGCADSRVPANELIGLQPGEVFVHRNVANLIVHSDLNCLAAMQFAVDILQVKHIIVCGHYGCGGVKSVLDNHRVGLADNWLRHIHDTKIKYANLLSQVLESDLKHNRLCELNVLEQVLNASHSTVVQDAWERGQSLTIHSWVYNLRDGLIRPIGLEVNSIDELVAQYEQVLGLMSHQT